MKSRAKAIAKEVGKELLWRLGGVLLAIIGGVFMYYVIKAQVLKMQHQFTAKPSIQAPATVSQTPARTTTTPTTPNP